MAQNSADFLELFLPRPALEYKLPLEKPKLPPLSGMAHFVNNFAQPQDPNYAPPRHPFETRALKRARINKLKLEKGAEKAKERLHDYNPKNDGNARGDPYRTLFVSNIAYQTTEQKLRREFEAFGPVKNVRLVYDKKTKKPRGYGFVEYVHSRDFKSACNEADGIKVDDRRVSVDVERGRTVQNWRPRSLGGGLGNTRLGGGSRCHLPHFYYYKHGSAARPRPTKTITKNDPHRSRARDKSQERSRERERSRDLIRSEERERSGERGHGRSRRIYCI